MWNIIYWFVFSFNLIYKYRVCVCIHSLRIFLLDLLWLRAFSNKCHHINPCGNMKYCTFKESTVITIQVNWENENSVDIPLTVFCTTYPARVCKDITCSYSFIHVLFCKCIHSFCLFIYLFLYDFITTDPNHVIILCLKSICWQDFKNQQK